MEWRVGLKTDGLKSRVQLLEPSGGAHKGAAGTQPGHKVGHPSFGLLPDLGTGGLIVGQPVGVVRILVGVEISLGLIAGQFPGPPDGAVRALVRFGPVNSGAIGPQNALALRRNIGRHRQMDCKPSAAPSMAKAMPVLPLVASSRTLPGP